MNRTEILNRRALLANGIGVAATVMAPVAWSAGTALPVPNSLADELALALKADQPLVVMVSLEGCPFCRSGPGQLLWVRCAARKAFPWCRLICVQRLL